MPKLVHFRAGKLVKEYPLKEGSFSIGRNLDNHITINDQRVSGCHATIKVVPNAYMDGVLDYVLEDNSSTNGTFINGKKINKPYMLKHRDAIQFDEDKLQFVDEQSLGYESTRILIREP